MRSISLSRVAVFTGRVVRWALVQKRGVGWVRRGTDVCYYQNAIKKKSTYYYTATFSVVFEHPNDTVYIAHSYPYTYSDLQRYAREVGVMET